MTNTLPTPIDLFAGQRPDGQAVIERVPALADEQPGRFLLSQSPLFVPGVAHGDIIDLVPGTPGHFRLHERSGQLAVRVYSRDDAERLAEELTPAVEKLGGRLDLQTPRALVYSIHVAVGFRDIEALFDQLVPTAAARWSYGNVYDPDTNQPLGWWEDLLQP